MPMESIMDQLAVSSKQLAATEETLAETGFYWRERDGVLRLVCRPLEEIGFANGFSTRLGGVSSLETPSGSTAPAYGHPSYPGGELTASSTHSAEAAATPPIQGGELNLAGFSEDSRENIFENRRRFLSMFEKEYRLATAWQVHGDNIQFVREHGETGDSDERADALVSNIEDVLLGVKTADCVPILIGDPATGAYAAVHAGWRGTAQSIVSKTVEMLTAEFGSDPADFVAAIGPAAGCELYEVGQDVIDAFAENFTGSEKYFAQTRPGHAFADIKAANRDQLLESGVSRKNIYIAPYCTMERVDLFFSYRIEKKKFGRTGRLMSVIGKI
jgi:YfiH family protein